MTRLTTNDICDISPGLAGYDAAVKKATGKSMLGIAAHSWGEDEACIAKKLKRLRVDVIPVTAGQGVITDFTNTVAAILGFLGCDARVSEESDASGLAAAYELETDAVMLADDFRFVGINLNTRRVVDNSLVTGRVFAAALDLMAGGLCEKPVLVMGCGPVGAAGAWALAEAGAIPVLYDTDTTAARKLRQRLINKSGLTNIVVLDTLARRFSDYSYILEATPSAESIPDELISDRPRLAAPGVPLGVSQKGARMLGSGLVHDKLELGVAAMAAGLVIDDI